VGRVLRSIVCVCHLEKELVKEGLQLFVSSYPEVRDISLVCVMCRLAIQRGDGVPIRDTQTPFYAVVCREPSLPV